MKYQVFVVKYGSAVIEADSKEEALEEFDYMFNDDFSWSDLDIYDLRELETFDM